MSQILYTERFSGVFFVENPSKKSQQSALQKVFLMNVRSESQFQGMTGMKELLSQQTRDQSLKNSGICLEIGHLSAIRGNYITVERFFNKLMRQTG